MAKPATAVMVVVTVETVVIAATATALLDVVAAHLRLGVVTILHAKTTDVTVVIVTENEIEIETMMIAADREALPTETGIGIAT